MGAMCTAILFSIILGLVLNVNAQTQKEKINLDILEQNLEWLEEKVDNLEYELEMKSNNSETKISKIEEELEFGGKKYETVQYTSK